MSSIFSKLFPSSTTPTSFLTPLKFTSCLGQGSFGIVLKAVEDTSETNTAVKFLFTLEASEEQQTQILRECQLSQDCKHKNVVKIIKVVVEKLTPTDVANVFKNFTQDEKCLSLKDMYVGKAKRYKTVEAVCIQMELCGEDLRQWLTEEIERDDPILQNKQRKITLDVIEGLKHLHNKKIIHRDLKPENIMFSNSGYKLPVKIGDFGLCRKIHSEETQTSCLTSRAGTQDYMAPESFTNLYSFQADLYSLGLVVWEIIQFIPFNKRRTMFDSLVNGKEEDLIQGHPMMSGVKELIIGLTQRKVEDRIKNFEEVSGHCKVWNEFTASNSGELRRCLENVDSGGTIFLKKWKFVGPFVLKKDRVRICGVERTILKQTQNRTACLTIEGCDCSVENMAFNLGDKNTGIILAGSNNLINNVKFTGGWSSIHVAGNENALQNIRISNSLNGIWIDGRKNNVADIDVNLVRNFGIRINYAENNVTNVRGGNVRYGWPQYLTKQ